MNRFCLIAFGATLLAGCNSAQQPGRGELFMDDAEVAAKDDAICKGYGAAPGSPAYIQCRAMQDQRRDTYREARRRRNEAEPLIPGQSTVRLQTNCISTPSPLRTTMTTTCY